MWEEPGGNFTKRVKCTQDLKTLDISGGFGHNIANSWLRKAKTEESKAAGTDREAEALTETSTREKPFEVPS